MAEFPRLNKTVAHKPTSGKAPIVVLTDQRLRDEALARLEAGISVSRPDGARYAARDFWGVALYAAAEQTSIEQACRFLVDTPHANTVRGVLTELKLTALEPDVNAMLAETVPTSLLRNALELAIDLKSVPYYGEVPPALEDFVRTNAAKHGTTTFFEYASCYAIKHNKRFTLALTAVRRSDTLADVLRRLLDRFAGLGGDLRCLYVDRQFYSVEALRFLVEQRDVPFAMAARKTGTTGGITGLIREHGTGVHSYTVQSPMAGSVTVDVAVVGKYLNGRWGKHEHEYYPYVIHRFPYTFKSLFDKYRGRFGIESGHRLWDEARAQTASRSVALRWVLISTAVFLYNLWTFLKWDSVSWPRRGGRRVFHDCFPFRHLCALLANALETLFGVVRVVTIPAPPE